MQKIHLLTLFMRVFSAVVLLVIAGLWAARRDWVPAILFTVLSAVVSTLAAGLYRKIRRERRAERQPEDGR